ncbi:MAG: YceI family protein [Leptospiraceae bacterium]|nr:YceI family protein [Leptospiraceae bacterium]
MTAFVLRTLTFSIMLLGSLPLAAKDWQIDYANSQLGFTIGSRLGDVDGIFHKWKFDGRIASDTNIQGQIVVDVASIDTQNQKRDDHLRDPDFFEVSKYPGAVFEIHSVDKGDSKYTLKGILKIRGISRPVTIPLKVKSDSESTMNLRGAFILDRRDFGITYNSFFNPMQDDVLMRIDLSLNK